MKILRNILLLAIATAACDARTVSIPPGTLIPANTYRIIITNDEWVAYDENNNQLGIITRADTFRDADPQQPESDRGSVRTESTDNQLPPQP